MRPSSSSSVSGSAESVGTINRMLNYYEILKITEAASPRQIKDAWHKQALRTHPDQGGSTVAFMASKEAFDTLSDPALRRAYDQDLLHKSSATGSESSKSQNSDHLGYKPGPAPPPPNYVATPTDAKPYPVFVFADGDSVPLSEINSHGVPVPLNSDRELFSMGPAWVYKIIIPNDPIFIVQAPTKNSSYHTNSSIFKSILRMLFFGPRYIKTAWSFSIALLFILAAAVAYATQAVLTTHSPPFSFGVALLGATILGLFWPISFICRLIWYKLPTIFSIFLLLFFIVIMILYSVLRSRSIIGLFSIIVLAFGLTCVCYKKRSGNPISSQPN